MPDPRLSLDSMWRTRQRRLRKLLLTRPGSIRAPYWRVQLHVLAFLLARYGQEENLHETRRYSPRGADVRPVTPSRLDIQRPHYEPRVRVDVRKCLLRIAMANLVREER